MPRKKTNDQPEAAVIAGQENQTVVAAEHEPKQSGITTTNGKVLDKIEVLSTREGVIVVKADYGQLHPEAPTASEQRKSMHTLYPHPLSPEDAKGYQRMVNENPDNLDAAKEYAARKAFPMHCDDAAFYKINPVNGKDVNYIIVDKIKAGDVNADNQHLVGRWQLKSGIKGVEGSHFASLLTKEEITSFANRAEVTFKEDKQGKKIPVIGAPITLSEFAAKVENRALTDRQDVENAKKVDWSKFTLPDEAKLTGMRFAPVKDDPKRVVLLGALNGVKVSAMLSKNESTAIRNKFATFDQVAAANKEFRTKVNNILGVGASQEKGVSVDPAVKAVIDRASDPAAKSFTPEQSGAIIKYLGDVDGDGRTDLVEELWKKAEGELDSRKVDTAWKEDAHSELKDLAQGVVRDPQQQMHR